MLLLAALLAAHACALRRAVSSTYDRDMQECLADTDDPAARRYSCNSLVRSVIPGFLCTRAELCLGMLGTANGTYGYRDCPPPGWRDYPDGTRRKEPWWRPPIYPERFREIRDALWRKQYGSPAPAAGAE